MMFLCVHIFQRVYQIAEDVDDPNFTDRPQKLPAVQLEQLHHHIRQLGVGHPAGHQRNLRGFPVVMEVPPRVLERMRIGGFDHQNRIHGFYWINGCNMGSTLQISPVDGRRAKWPTWMTGSYHLQWVLYQAQTQRPWWASHHLLKWDSFLPCFSYYVNPKNGEQSSTNWVPMAIPPHVCCLIFPMITNYSQPLMFDHFLIHVEKCR